MTEVAKELQKDTDRPGPARSARPGGGARPSRAASGSFPTLIEGLGGAATVIVLVIFMLIEREDLRNRLIRLGGYGRLATTTRALDEAGQRISRYLLMQSIINASFGIGIAIGLLLLGVPYALLWGFLAAVLRFIPYVGVWLAALLLVVFALAAFPTWHQPLLVVGALRAPRGAGCSFALEPLLYGQSAGVSQVALLCSVAFWAWLWGPIGLLLADAAHGVPGRLRQARARHGVRRHPDGRRRRRSPRTSPTTSVCSPRTATRRRASSSEYSKDHPLEAVYDDLILPALGHARRDRRNGQLPEAEERYVWERHPGDRGLGLHARRRAAKLAADRRGGTGPPDRAAARRSTCSPVRCATRRTCWG